MAQSNKTCKHCSEVGHSGFYCKKKPIKPIKGSPIKPTQQIKKVAKAKSSTIKGKKAKSRGQLVRELDSIFSQYIRMKNSVDGRATCVTCGDTKEWKLMQNGHFFTRGRFPTRWDEQNCHIQDYRCNVLFNGNYIKYTTYMIDRYGREAVDELERKSQSGTKISTPELRELIEQYKMKVKEL